MARPRLAVGAGCILVAILCLLLTRRGPHAPPQTDVSAPSVTNSRPPSPFSNRTAGALPGDALLADYASPGSTTEQDLGLMARAMDSFLLLAKPGGRGPLADNQDWAAAWLGRSGSREPFASAGLRVFGSDARLVDRWGTALFIHALGGGRFEIRSAGPDRRLWTDDDIHRNADGSFLRGTNLNPSSLRQR